MTENEWRSLDLFAPTPEHALLAETLREFVLREVEPQAADHDRDETFNVALFHKAGDLGLLGVTLPEELGGAGLDATAAVQVCEALSTADPGFALSVLAHAILFAQNVNVNGNETQRKHVLPKAATGEWIGGMCMTEPAVGTDVIAMKTRARRDADGYVIDGTKTFITNGGVDDETLGDAFIVYAATGEREITSFLVEKGTPGFRLGQKWKDKLGMRASFTAELVFDERSGAARQPHRRGGRGHPADDAEPRGGAAHPGRHVDRASRGAACEVMIDYANERKTFGVPIREHGQIQRYIAETFAEFRAARTATSTTPRAASTSHRTGQRARRRRRRSSSASQVGKRAADAAIQVLGGYGYMGEYVVERLWRDAKLIEIGGGTLEAHHKNLTKDLCRNPALVD